MNEPAHKLNRQGKKSLPNDGYIVAKLKTIGVPETMFPRGHGGFWKRGGESFYLAILEKARDLFHARIKRQHCNGTFTELGRKLIEAWQFIQRAFKKRGWELA